MGKTLEQLQSDLALAESNLEKDAIKKNPLIYNSIKDKISRLKKEIAEQSSSKKTVVEKTEKKKEKSTVKKQEKKTKESVTKSGFSIGEKVSYEDKTTQRKKSGAIIKMNVNKGTHFALVKTSDKDQWVSINRLTKI